MLNEQVLLRPAFALQAPSAETITSDLQLINNYFAHSTDFIGVSIVNEFTVRSFLDDSANEQVATNFFNFLKNNTTTEEFRNVFQDNKKLSKTFNDFYLQNVSQSISTGKTNNSVVRAEVGVLSAVTFNDVNFDWQTNQRIKRVSNVLGEFSKELSFYIPVYLYRNNSQLSVSSNDKYEKDTIEGISAYTETLVINKTKQIHDTGIRTLNIFNENTAKIEVGKALSQDLTFGNSGITLENTSNVTFGATSNIKGISGISTGLVINIGNTPSYEIDVRTKKKPKKLVQSFMDLNLNDNESEFWRNDNLKVVKK